MKRKKDFYPRSPRGERLAGIHPEILLMRFLPALPARGATRASMLFFVAASISTRAPREGSDDIGKRLTQALIISTRAPREGSDGRHAE